MDSDGVLIHHLVNPCCAALKEKYSKLEASRKALREGVKIQNELIDKLQKENLTLKKAYEEEKIRVDNEREEKSNESANRVSLEKEIVVLKSEIHTLHQKEGSRSQAEDVSSELLLLRTRHAEMETEIAKLRELVEEGRVQADFERLEKSKESANRVLLEKEIDVLKSEIHSFQRKEGSKSKVEDVDGELLQLRTQNAETEMEVDKLKELLKQEKLKIDAERLEKSRESTIRVSLEKEIDVLKAEIHSLHQRQGSQSEDKDNELLLLRTRHAEMEAEIDKLKELAEKERKKADREKKKADAEKKAATKASEALKVEKGRIDIEQRLANAERKRVEESRIQLEKLKSEAEEARSQLLAEALKSEEANKKLELERHKVLNEKRRADVEMGKVEKQIGMYQKKAMDEKCRADHLSQQLEELKQRIQNQQKRADSETNRVEQMKKLVEVNENKALEEKHRADQLARQFEDHEEKIDHLQKELSILASSRLSLEAPLVLHSRNMESEKAELEMMKKHLKLKTKQVKHAKEVAKLERDRKDMLQQKLVSITHEFVQFLQRINVLGDCFTQHNEGRDKSDKKNVSNSSGLELLNKYSDQVHFHPDNMPVNCSSSLLPAAGRNSTNCISGIDFKMGNLLRCSERKMLESSAINSTMASFSDRPLMETQGKGALAVTTSAKLPEENLNSRSKVPSMEISGQSPAKYDGIKKGKNSKKRKSITDAVKSVEQLYSEGKKWQMLVQGQLSELNGMLKSQTGKSLQEKSNVEQQQPEQSRVKKRRKESPAEEVAMQLFDTSNNNKDRVRNEGTEEANVCNEIIVPDKDKSDVAHTHAKGTGDFFKESPEMGCFLEVIQENYMKLLDLDGDADEERYRRAIERPLSPFVPVIELQNSDTTRHGSDNHECYSEGVLTDNNNLLPPCGYNVANMEIEKLNLSRNENYHNPLLSPKNNIVCVAEDITNNKNCGSSSIYEDTASAKHVQESEELAGLSDLCRSSNNITRMSCPSTLVITSAKPPKYCVIFADNEHESSIARIYHAIKMCMDQCSMTFEMDEAMLKCMLAILKMKDVSPQERASVVFSVLLNLLEMTLEVGKSLPTNVIQLSDSFARCLHKDADVQTRFAELCFSAELLGLIEEFLLDRRLLVHTDVSSEASPVTGFRVNMLLNDKHITLSRTLASRCQLLPGSVILASICATTDRIGFLCETSHNILRLHKLDNSVLDILHVFAYVCGPKYFTVEDYSLTMIVVRSLVTILERENVSRVNAYCLPSDFEVQRKFPSCTKCPFSEGAVSVDEVICLLLDKLQNYSLCAITNHPVIPVNHEKSIHHLEAYDSCPLMCSANCCFNKFGMTTCRSTSICNGNFCHCTDVVSLVELVASYMHWDWTCNYIITPMLNLLDCCALGDFFTIFVVFLGKLGRLGVDASGYDDKGVESLRSHLSALLYQNSFKELAFTTQIAVIYSLVGIIPLNLAKLMKTNAEIPLIDRHIGFANFIRKWLSTLSSVQRSLSLGFLESANELSSTAA